MEAIIFERGYQKTYGFFGLGFTGLGGYLADMIFVLI